MGNACQGAFGHHRSPPSFPALEQVAWPDTLWLRNDDKQKTIRPQFFFGCSCCCKTPREELAISREEGGGA